tara:strand:+ start:433 stop:627 length:195 start_codon:yes stop_codon:yes gene_type:complete
LYHKKGGITLLGKCNWWYLYEDTEPKEIPTHIIDKGCKFWTKNVKGVHPLFEKIIKKFKGRLIA